MDREKTALDLDTLTALLGSRFHVMADYAKRVLKTVHREELEKAETGIRRQLKATGSLLGRDRSLMNDKQRLLLRDGLKHSSALTVLCDFRKQLQQIFTERTASPERLLAQLQEWCGRAEATGDSRARGFRRLATVLYLKRGAIKLSD
jgi:stearoyl-CoA desaturase (delta-9 desaturase)